jgi:tetratricopeptide (TPR) repeat protein
MGDFDEAEKCYKEMLTELADEHYNDQENQGQFIFANIVRCSNLKRCYIGLRNIANRRNNKELALEYEENAKTIGDALQSVIEAFASQFQDQSASAEPNYTKMAKEYWNQGEFDLALENYEKAIEKYSENDNNDQLSKCHYESALVCQDAKMWDQALEHFFSVLNIKKLILPKNHPDIASIYCDIGKVFIEKRDCVGALEHFEQAHKIYVLCLPPQHPEMGRLLLLMGLAHVGNGDKSTARQIIGEGISIVRQSDPEKAAELENQFIALCN